MAKLTIIPFLATLLISLSLYAAPAQVPQDSLKQSTTAEESSVNEVRWYQVELLIFKQRPLSTELNEFWPKNITLSYPDNWDTLKTPEQYQAIYHKPPQVNTPFIFLDKKYFKFQAIKSKLQLNRNEILFHGAWRQSLTQNLDQKVNVEVPSILIRGGNLFDDHAELEGSISLSLLRYLHIKTNLWLTTFAPASAAAPAAVGEAVTAWPELPVFPLPSSAKTESATPTLNMERKFQIEQVVINKQSRRMRSHETHYIDHPKFGILIRMTPLDTNTLQPIPPRN